MKKAHVTNQLLKSKANVLATELALDIYDETKKWVSIDEYQRIAEIEYEKLVQELENDRTAS